MRRSLPMKEPALPCPVWGMEGSGMTMREMQDIPSVVRRLPIALPCGQIQTWDMWDMWIM